MDQAPRPDREHDALLARLGEIVDVVDPVPEPIYQMAYGAYALRDLDAELARLVDDSALDGAVPAGVRSGGSDVRTLSFQGRDVTIELQVTRHAERRSVLGEVVGGEVAEIRLEGSRLAEAVAVDDLGRFSVDDLPSGPVRLRIADGTGTQVVTDWVAL